MYCGYQVKQCKNKLKTLHLTKTKFHDTCSNFTIMICILAYRLYIKLICLHINILYYSIKGFLFWQGLDEELSVYKRASNKNVYLNVACNTIKRLRTETAEFCSSPTKPTSPQKMSHEAMLGGKNATKTTYTLNRSGGSYRGPMENFKGKLCS